MMTTHHLRSTTWCDLLALDYDPSKAGGSAAHEYIEQQAAKVLAALAAGGLADVEHGAEMLAHLQCRPFPFLICRKILRKLNPPSVAVVEKREAWLTYKWDADPCRPKAVSVSSGPMPMSWAVAEDRALHILGEDPDTLPEVTKPAQAAHDADAIPF